MSSSNNTPQPERLTYREKRERKAERLREWADKRKEKQGALNEAARSDEAATGIPFGQPILVGHHSERRHRAAIARVDRAMDAAVDNSRKAAAMASRAENIERAYRQAIYNDDPDAVEALEAKITRLEAERERIKAYNKTCKPGQAHGDLSILTESEQRGLLATIRAVPYQCKNGRMPAYTLQSLGGNISRLRKRLESLKAPERPRMLTARYAGECRKCGVSIEKGATIAYYKRSREVECEGCTV